MCGRYTLAAGPIYFQEYFDIDLSISQYAQSYNIAPSQTVPVIVQNDTGRIAQQMKWGLLPSWSKESKSKYQMINARVETLTEKKTFKHCLTSQRCLVPATGFYEWTTENGSKQPHYIFRPDYELFAFAGLWDVWHKQGDDEIHSFTIITTAANQYMQTIHQRMPVILDPHNFDSWLNPDNHDLNIQIETLNSNRDIELESYPVSTRVNNPRNNDADLLERLTN
ncbi:MAG: SOS response-associated peptidase [Gammaproteobacteria bacterium]|nr:SOS response-associated peptidase [Gammaproteobacteria bacterium]MDH5778169.1 SOS response-associated peptidase [Gammaproteobacteria bacterium]